MSKNNAILIDYGWCSGCHSCELACRNELGLGLDEWGIKVLEDQPRQNSDGSWHWDYIAVPTELCNGCASRVEEGKLPACVQTCQGKVLYYGTPEEMLDKAANGSEMSDKVAIYLV